MAKFQPMKHIKNAFRKVYHRAEQYVKSFTRQTDEVLAEEHIDFSAPSIPYYENLANRLSFVRIVLYMVLFVFIVGTVISNHKLITYENVYYLAKDIGAATLTAQSRAEHISYPISSSESDFALYRGGVVAAGGQVVTAMSGSGRQTLSVNVAYGKPQVRSSDRYYVTFGLGETSFSVYNSFVRVKHFETEYPVYDGAVGDNGCFAILTRSRDYTSDVMIYDSDMTHLATHHLNGYVTALSMNREGDYLGILSSEAVNGQWVTTVTVIRIGNKITQSTAKIEGVFGSTAGFITDNRFAVLLSDRLMVFATDATVEGETYFEGIEPTLCAIGNGRVAVLSKVDADLNLNSLTVYDRNARSVYSLSLDVSHPIRMAGGAESMTFGDNILFIKAGEQLFRISAGGDSITAATISRDTLEILPRSGDDLLVCTPAYAMRLDKNDFAAP